MNEEEKATKISLPLIFTVGIISSFCLFFSYPPLSYILMILMFSGLIAGLIFIEGQTSKKIRFMLLFSNTWLIILLAMSVAKTLRPYVAI